MRLQKEEVYHYFAEVYAVGMPARPGRMVWGTGVSPSWGSRPRQRSLSWDTRSSQASARLQFAASRVTRAPSVAEMVGVNSSSSTETGTTRSSGRYVGASTSDYIKQLPHLLDSDTSQTNIAAEVWILHIKAGNDRNAQLMNPTAVMFKLKTADTAAHPCKCDCFIQPTAMCLG